MKRADLQLVALWGLTAALGAAFVRAELVKELAPPPPPAAVQPVPMTIVVPLPGAGKVKVPQTSPPAAAPKSPFAVGGHRKIDGDELRRLIQAGELSDREAMDYGEAP